MILYKCNACGAISNPDKPTAMVQLTFETRDLDGTVIMAPITYHVCDPDCVSEGSVLAGEDMTEKRKDALKV